MSLISSISSLIPSETTAIIYGICALVGIVALVIFRSYLIPWLQKYQTEQDTTTITNNKIAAQQADAAENDESDALKKLDGR